MDLFKHKRKSSEKYKTPKSELHPNQLTSEETHAFQKLVDDNLNDWHKFCRENNFPTLFISFTRERYEHFQKFLISESRIDLRLR